MTTALLQKPAPGVDQPAGAERSLADDADAGALGEATLSRDDLMELMTAYNAVTERLQASHEALQTETQRLRDELASTNAQLQRSKRLSALGEMAAGIAHEIRNPLAAIRLYAEMVGADLQQTQVASLQTARRHNASIQTAVEGLCGIVQDVLSFATQVTPQPREVRPADVFKAVHDCLRPTLDAAGVSLSYFDDGTPLHADPDLLRQALLNLVRNACDAIQAQAEPGQVVLSCTGGTTLRVTDTGPGIPDGLLDRLFNPFFTTRSTGTGLGLAIVHRTIEAHGGSIEVCNRIPPRRGASFELHLPLPG